MGLYSHLTAEQLTARRDSYLAVISAMGALVHRTRLEADGSLLLGCNDLAAKLEAN